LPDCCCESAVTIQAIDRELNGNRGKNNLCVAGCANHSYPPTYSQQSVRKILVDGNAIKHRSDNNHSLDTLATLLGFQPLPLSFMLVLGALGAADVTAAENVKRGFSILVKFYLSRRSTYEFRQIFLLFRAIIGFSKLAT
jgi:hypothetical protein